MSTLQLIDTTAPIGELLNRLNSLTDNCEQSHRKLLNNSVASAYAVGFYGYQNDYAALIQEMTLRQVAEPGEGDNVWAPIAQVSFGSFDPEAANVQFMGVRGLTPYKPYGSWQKYAGAMRLMDENDVHPDNAVAFIENFGKGEKGLGGLSGMVAADRKKHAKTRAPRKPVTDARRAELTSLAKALPVLAITVPKAVVDGAASTAGRFAQAWVYIEDGQVFMGDIIPDSEKAAIRAAADSYDAAEALPEPAPAPAPALFEATPEMIAAAKRGQKAFLARKNGGVA